MALETAKINLNVSVNNFDKHQIESRLKSEKMAWRQQRRQQKLTLMFLLIFLINTKMNQG